MDRIQSADKRSKIFFAKEYGDVVNVRSVKRFSKYYHAPFSQPYIKSTPAKIEPKELPRDHTVSLFLCYLLKIRKNFIDT